jgi:hypothetical protein
MTEVDMGPPSPAPSVVGKSHDEMIDVMVKWFFQNFEDPAEETPYESAEGGYQYIWGGPYDANEELQAAFCPKLEDPTFEVVEKAAIAAAEKIEEDGWEWAPASSRHIEVDD